MALALVFLTLYFIVDRKIVYRWHNSQSITSKVFAYSAGQTFGLNPLIGNIDGHWTHFHWKKITTQSAKISNRCIQLLFVWLKRIANLVADLVDNVENVCPAPCMCSVLCNAHFNHITCLLMPDQNTGTGSPTGFIEYIEQD